jgi:hypothetical protein
MLRHSRCTRTSVYHNVYEQGAEMVTGIQILVCLGDFGQIPGPSSVLFGGCCGVLRFPRTPPPFFPAQKKRGGTAGGAREKNTPALQRYSSSLRARAADSNFFPSYLTVGFGFSFTRVQRRY